MRNTWAQRARREGVVVRTVSFPVPLLSPAALLDALEAARTPRTKVVHVSHVVFLTGQILPVAEVCAWARRHGITSIVDGAHAFAHADTNLPAMGCDTYGTSLHKWLMAPIGTGFLYMRRDRIAGHWALQPGGARTRTTTSASSRRSGPTRRRPTTPSRRRSSSTGASAWPASATAS